MTAPDTLTLLHAPGRRLAKRVRANGTVDAYQGAKHSERVNGIDTAGFGI